MNIPNEVKNLFRQDSINKNFRVHFPNGERPDICNDHIESESVSFTDSVCSGQTLKFGICEAARFECTVNDIEEKYIIDENGGVQLNPTPLRGNIKGLEIEVSQEIDISSLPEEFIAEYGQNAEDVPYPFYSIPRGTYTINSCKKQSNMDKRQIVAYDMLKSSVIDASCMPWLEHIYYDFYAPYDGFAPPVRSMHSLKLQDCLYSALAYKGISADSILERLNDGTLEIQEDFLVVKGYPNGDGIPYIFGKKPSDPAAGDTVIAVPSIDTTLPYGVCGIHTYTNEITHKGKFMVAVTYDMDEVSAYNKEVNRLKGTVLTAEERLQEIQNQLFITVPYVNGENTGSFYILPNTVVDCSETGTVSGALDVHGRWLIYEQKRYERYTDNPYYYIGIAAYNIVKSVSVLKVEDEPTASGLDFKIVYYPENQNANVDAQKLTWRNLISSILEIDGFFGIVGRDGCFLKEKLGGEYCTLSSGRILTDKRMLNCSEECTIPGSEEISVWYDLDEQVEGYGKIAVKSPDSNEELVNFSFSDGARKYIFEGNILLESGLYTIPEMYEICKKLHQKIHSIKIVPLTASVKGNPLRRIGEYVAFNDAGRYVGSYILSRTMDGVINLQDEIDSTNISD